MFLPTAGAKQVYLADNLRHMPYPLLWSDPAFGGIASLSAIKGRRVAAQQIEAARKSKEQGYARQIDQHD